MESGEGGGWLVESAIPWPQVVQNAELRASRCHAGWIPSNPGPHPKNINGVKRRGGEGRDSFSIGDARLLRQTYLCSQTAF